MTFEEKTAMVYNINPKIRIVGTGFDTLDAGKLELSFAPTLKEGRDFTMEVQSSEVIVISLKEGKRLVLRGG